MTAEDGTPGAANEPSDFSAAWGALGELARALLGQASVEAVGAAAVAELERRIGSCAAGLWVADRAGEPPRLVAQHGLDAAAEGGSPTGAAAGPLGEAFRTGRAVETADAGAIADAGGPTGGAAEGARRLLAQPIVGTDGVLGVLGWVVRDGDDRGVGAGERGLLGAVAELCAAALENLARIDELRRDEEGYRLAVRASTDVVWDWDAATGEVSWNAELRRAFGWSPDEPGRTLDRSLAWLLERVHPADRRDAQAALDGVMAGRDDEWLVEYRFRRADGIYGVVLERGRAERGPDGRPRRIVSTMRDITRRKNIEEGQRFLAEASRVLASSLEYETTLRTVARLAIPDLADWCAVDLLDERGGARPVPGAHADPAKEKVLHELQQRYPPTTADERPVARALRTGHSVLEPTLAESELEATSVDAEHAALRRAVGFASLLVAPLVVGGRTLGAITFARGLDRPRYRIEDLPVAEELARRCAVAIDNARLYADAQEAIRARDQFLSIAAHELRTPVTGIKGYAQALLRAHRHGRLGEERLIRGLERLDASSDRLTALTQDLLDVGRIRTGQLALRFQDVDLGAFARELATRFWEMVDGEHQLELDIADEPCPAQVDPDRIEQVLVNLLENAIKYSPEGGTIRMAVRREGEGIAITVQDEGIGLPTGEAERIFTPFGRAPNAAERNLPGMGLGLFIGRGIVERHHGTIRAESPGDGQGTTFHVWLPCDGLRVEAAAPLQGRDG